MTQTDATTSALPSSLAPPLAQALAERGYTELTPVQTAVSDPALDGRDLLVSAQTGSGKTVAFGLALAHSLFGDAPRLPPPDLPRALVIAPTRELALQVKRELDWLYAPANGVSASCVGGMDMRGERRTLDRGAHIVVGTPGRLRDHVERGSLDLSALSAVVLDEADEMLDLGFREDLEFLLERAPDGRRTLLFSATVAKPIADLARSFQKDAVRISTIAERAAHLDIDYRALAVEGSDREIAILNVLRYYEAPAAIVFCSTRAAVSHLAARLGNRGFPVVALSGELSQQERSHALQSLRDGRARVCVATDVAARGIDLPGLDLVVHADLPTNKEGLLHRSGRTGRAGRKGVSVLIVPPAARKRTERLLQFAGVTAAWGVAPSVEEVTARDGDRLLADPALTAPMAAEEAERVAALTAAFGAEALATAVLRLYMAGRCAPEELREPGPRERRDHGAFDNAAWAVLSVGHADRAEARWLLPMLCRNGGITRADIGAIRVGEAETYVQIAAAAAPGFWEALGPGLELEDGIRVRRGQADDAGIAGTPAAATHRPRERRAPEGRAPEGRAAEGRDGAGRAAEGRAAEGRAGKAGAASRAAGAPRPGGPPRQDAGPPRGPKGPGPARKPRKTGG